MLGKPSPAYFASALDALGAEPELTWLVGDDAESDVRAAQLFGMKIVGNAFISTDYTARPGRKHSRKDAKVAKTQRRDLQ